MHYNSTVTGEVIRELRKRKGWTQVILADFAGIRREQLSEIENGRRKPSVETLWKIASALDIPLSGLLRMAEERMEASRVHTIR